MSIARQIRVTLKQQLKPLKSLRTTIKAKREAASAFSSPELPLVMVYQMGKVGSTTVYKSLLDSPLPNPIVQLHILSDELPRYRRSHVRAGLYPPPYHIYLSAAIRRAFERHRDFPIKIISLVRDPISVMISSLFENPYFARERVYAEGGSIDPQRATEYLERRLSNPDAFGYIYGWFDRELKTVFGIDVFADPFPVETGHAVYAKGNVEALVIRLENLTECGPKALCEFLCLDDPIVLKQANVRSESPEKEAYRTVLANIGLSPSLCKRIYSDRFVKHFYTDAMIDVFTSKWIKSSLDSSVQVA